MPPQPQPTSRASDDTQTWSLFVLLSLAWGCSFLFIKIGLDEGLAPLAIVSYALVIGGLVLMNATFDRWRTTPAGAADLVEP